jgi:hypothetical protein
MILFRTIFSGKNTTKFDLWGGEESPQWSNIFENIEEE